MINEKEKERILKIQNIRIEKQDEQIVFLLEEIKTITQFIENYQEYINSCQEYINSCQESINHHIQKKQEINKKTLKLYPDEERVSFDILNNLRNTINTQ